MSRSRRRTPISGIAVCRSERQDKLIWHRRARRAVRQMLSCGEEDIQPSRRLLGDPWDFGKDGKRWLGDWEDYHLILRK
jgi:hypothetical protein